MNSTRRGLSALAGGIALPSLARAQAQPIEISLWFSLTRPLSDIVEGFARDFNASQTRFRVVPTFKGVYPESLAAAIAAVRAGNPPHILHAAEIATATLSSAPGVAKPVQDLFQEAGIAFDADDYLPAIRQYYSTPQGKLLAIPFFVPTGVVFYNKDAFRRAGLDPDRPPTTWSGVKEAAERIVAARAAATGISTAWPGMLQLEHLLAFHNQPYATRGNGFQGLDAELVFNNPTAARHFQNLADWQRAGLFKYGGRDFNGDSVFVSGESAIHIAASSVQLRIQREANFASGISTLPYYDDVPGAPVNSIISGSNFWSLAHPRRTADEYRGVAEFLRFITQPQRVFAYTSESWVLPNTRSAFEYGRAQGFYDRTPDALVAYRQVTKQEPTENSRGIRLGGLTEIRSIVEEELERTLQGAQTGQQALDRARTRGNQVLRNFERTARR
nr:extracellular solute-binding protein [uncultured Roseococcus sp.]